MPLLSFFAMDLSFQDTALIVTTIVVAIFSAAIVLHLILDLTRDEAREREIRRDLLGQREGFLRQLEHRVSADKRSLALLKQHLSTAQWEMLKANGYFKVISQSGAEYLIGVGRSMNVLLLRAGLRLPLPWQQFSPYSNSVVYCAYPATRTIEHEEIPVPYGDAMLMQKLYLENAEEEFVRLAGGGMFLIIQAGYYRELIEAI